MLFDSLSFLIFFPTVVVLYFLCPPKFRVLLLLIASCIFYASYVPKYLLILFFLITLDFFLAQQIATAAGKLRTVLLWISISANLGMLFAFKYLNFFFQNVSTLAHFLHWNYSPTLLTYLLPLGLSFHVFQSLSYVIEVYRGKYVPERNYLTYALYVMFFPQLVAGPIERPQHLLPQFKNTYSFDEQRVTRGLERMLWGFFKKLVIADNIALIVNHIYAGHITDGPILILVVFLFAYQLYCDFSGYSDIAVGAALVLGFELTENFNRPYAARSVSDFWRRWHISLSSWLRDYLYYPLVLSGKKHSRFRLYLSLFITFVLIGLWHGANWTYVAMGALFGTYLILESLTEKWRKKLFTTIWPFKIPLVPIILETGITFVLVCIAWVFFRSETILQAFTILTHLGTGLSQLHSLTYIRYTLLGNPGLGVVSKLTLAGVIVSILYLEIVQYLGTQKNRLDPWTLWPGSVRFGWRYATLIAILLLGYFGGLSFIYFQF